MIKVKTFPLDKAEEANKFLESQLPFTTEKGQGIQVHQGHIVVFYNDGVYNPLYSKQKFTELMNKEEEQIALFKHNLLKHEANLRDSAPQGYSKGMTDVQINDLFKAEIKEENTSLKTSEQYKLAKTKTEEIVQIENDILLTMHSIEHSTKEIELYKETLKTYK